MCFEEKDIELSIDGMGIVFYSPETTKDIPEGINFLKKEFSNPDDVAAHLKKGDDMKYFITNSEKIGTCYHEFFKGKWDGETFWKEDSLLLHDEVMFSHKGFVDAIKKIVQHYDPYSETEISLAEWIAIGKQINDKESRAVYDEANDWVEQVFEKYDCFTILGL